LKKSPSVRLGTQAAKYLAKLEGQTMEKKLRYAQGLTRIILETMLENYPELAAEGAPISDELMHSIELRVREQLLPSDEQAKHPIFEMTLRRSFQEAKAMLDSVAALDHLHQAHHLAQA
jgi:hypothetical protein